MSSIRPFRFTGLPQWSRAQVAVQESLARYLSHAPFAPGFGASIEHMLERYLKVPCTLSLSDIRQVRRSEVARLFPKTSCVVVLGAAPTEHKIVVDVDIALTAWAIDRLLGGAGDTGRVQRPLTEIEEGVISFLLLKVLGLFREKWTTGQEIALTLDQFASKPEEVAESIEGVEQFHVVQIHIAAKKMVGYARILLPAELIGTNFSSPPPQSSPSAAELDGMRRILRGIGESTVFGRVEVATLDLSPEDIAGLERGDIIILDAHRIAKTPLGVEGEAFVKIGEGCNGGIRGRLLNEGDSSKLEIVELVVKEQPEEMPMADSEAPLESAPEEGAERSVSGSAPAPDDNLAETEGLLRDIPAPVVVELGRIRMNTHQITRLHVGQVLRLPRGPNDPVSLVVNGKLFARGELVEIDGELGVRLLKVAGN